MNEETLSLINSIKAKKITQMPILDNEDFEHLWVLLGYKNEEENRAENYKVNIYQLAQLLIDTGMLTGGGNTHTITYSLTNITTTSPDTFKGTGATITLTPAKGYVLPEQDDITVSGANIVSYNSSLGVLKISTNPTVENITIAASGIQREYSLNLYLDYIISDLDNIHELYHIDDEIEINLETTEQDRFDLPERSAINISNATIKSYQKDGATGRLTIKVNGTGNITIKMAGVRVYVYYFGHSIPGDHILDYDYNDIPTGAGYNFGNLTKSRGGCPINFNANYVWPEGIDSGDVYVIVPKKFFIPGANVYRDESYNGYDRVASTLGVKRIIQESYTDNSLMCYEFTYQEIDYWAYCISREGISEFDKFNSIGNLANIPIYIEWVATIPLLASNKDIVLNPGYCNVTFGNDSNQKVNWPNFTISASVGTINNNESGSSIIYHAPIVTEDSDVTFTAKLVEYQGVKDTKEATIPAPGEDDNLVHISYDLGFDEIESGQSLILDKTRVIGYYRDDSNNPDNLTQRALPRINSIAFSKVKGSISKIDDKLSMYTAPSNILTDTQETITVTYKTNWSYPCPITIKPVDFVDIYWPTKLPYSIYDNELISPVDVTCYKEKPNGSYEKITEPVTLTVSAGSYANNIFTPPTVQSNTQVVFTLSWGNFTTMKQVTIKPAAAFTNSSLYYYIGQYLPSTKTNPENDLIQTNSSSPGWRKINDPLSTYRSTNTSPTSIIKETIKLYENVNDSVIYYVVVPDYVEIFDNNTTNSNIQKYGDPINIGGLFYNAYRINGNSFSKKLFYVKPPMYYWYIGVDDPVSPDENPNLITYTNNATGWHIIPNDVTTYTDSTNNPIWSINGNDENSIAIAPGMTPVSFYLALPRGVKAIDGLGSTVTLTPVNRTMVIDNYTYIVYTYRGLDWAYTLYYDNN